MGDTTGIGWTNRSWNPWHGCARVSPGCDHCYMMEQKRRYGQDGERVVRSKTTFTVPLNALTTETSGRVRIRVTAHDGPPLRIATYSPGTKESPMSAKKRKHHQSDPAACQVCARMQEKEGPEARCKRHGGPSRSTSGAAGKRVERQRQVDGRAAPVAQGRKVLPPDSLAARIRDLVGIVDLGKAAERELAAVRAALAD